MSSAGISAEASGIGGGAYILYWDANAKKLWKAGWSEKANEKRFPVKAKVLRALGLAGYVLDKNQYKEVERDWRWMIANPNVSYSGSLADICFYFQTTKDKRHCRLLAEELDDPTAGLDANDPNTPPVDRKANTTERPKT